jgi:dUTP pyrophosphatase
VKFEKVKKEFFANDSFKNGFENAEEAYEKIVLPVRKTEGSAAYDFSLCYDLDLYGGERRIVPTGIKAIMDKGEVLLLTVRSSVGIKDGVLFSNGLAVIDSDFANNESDDGDIKLALWNTTGKLVRYKAGDRIAQGMFFKFDITEDDNASGVRIGGVGSTGKE